MWAPAPGQEEPLEEEMAAHRESHGQEPGRLQSIELQRVGHDWGDSAGTRAQCITAPWSKHLPQWTGPGLVFQAWDLGLQGTCQPVVSNLASRTCEFTFYSGSIEGYLRVSLGKFEPAVLFVLKIIAFFSSFLELVFLGTLFFLES